MFHTRLHGGKAFAAEQKIRELNLLKTFKKNRIRPNKLIRKAVQNMNEPISTKYGFAPEATEKRSLNQKYVLISMKFMILLD